MTKAKAKKRTAKSRASVNTAKVWALVNEDGSLRQCSVNEDHVVFWRMGTQTIRPATITWTEPRRAKR